MYRLSFVILVLAFCFSCGPKKNTGVSSSGPKKNTEASEPIDPLANLKKNHRLYQKLLKLYPNRLSSQKENANIILREARQKHAQEFISLYEKELKRIDLLFRTKCENIFKNASQKAESVPSDDVGSMWRERWAIWGDCKKNLEKQNRLPGFKSPVLLKRAGENEAFAGLMEQAYMRLSTHLAEAKAAIDYQQDPSEALAQIIIFRSWLKAHGIYKSSDGNKENEVEKKTGKNELVTKIDSLIAKYQKLCIEKHGKKENTTSQGNLSEIAEIPFEEIKAAEFLVYFNWISQGGECETVEDTINVNTTEHPGMIEALDEAWDDFYLEFEVQMVSGTEIWIGARPVIDTGRSEYKAKTKVAIPDKEWHCLRIQVENDSLNIFELKGKDRQPSSLSDPVVLRPVSEGNVKGGFMIGLGPNVEIKLRNFRFKILAGTKTGNKSEKKDKGKKE